MTGRLTRRQTLRLAAVGTVGAALAACGATPTPEVVKEVVTQVVEREVTKIVEGTPQVVKETVVVENTVVVEKIVTVEAPEQTEGPVNITWGMYQFEPWLILLKEIFKQFQEANPSITVQLVEAPYDQLFSKAEAQAIAGDPLNVCIGDLPWTMPWGKRGLLRDLTPLLEMVDTSIFFPGVVCNDTINPETWTGGCNAGGNVTLAFPGNGTCMLVYLNMKLLKEAGLDYPGEDWTWDDFKRYAIALTKDANGNHPGESGFDKENRVQYGTDESFGFGYYAVMWDFLAHAEAHVTDMERTKCLLSEPQALDTLNWIYDLAITEGTSPIPGGFTGIAQPFFTGQIGMVCGGSWNVDPWAAELTDFEWDVARYPIGPAGPDHRISYNTGWGNSLCIFKDAKFQRETWDVFKYALMTEEGTYWFGTAGVPTVKAAAQTDEFLNRPNGKHIPAHRELQIVNLEEEVGWNSYEGVAEGDNDIITVLTNEMANLALGRTVPQEYVQTVCAEIEKVWARTE